MHSASMELECSAFLLTPLSRHPAQIGTDIRYTSNVQGSEKTVDPLGVWNYHVWRLF